MRVTDDDDRSFCREIGHASNGQYKFNGFLRSRHTPTHTQLFALLVGFLFGFL